MPAVPTPESPNIALLDSLIIADLCAGNFIVDLTPSVYNGTGYNNVLGASVRITSPAPYNTVLKDFPTDYTYDIIPPLTDQFSFPLPTQAGNYQYGKYKVDVQLTDADGTVYVVSKTISICAPDKANRNRNYGTLSAKLDGVCREGKLYVSSDGVPAYQGFLSASAESAFVLQYPTSGPPPLETPFASFTTVLFEGEYKFTGTVCASYDMGDHVYAKVNYQVSRTKNVRCLLDESCIYARLASLDAQTRSDCTDGERADTQFVIVNTMRLLKTIEIAVSAGFDASDFISELEDLLGCVCTCNCTPGTPVFNNTPATDILIEGCNVVSTVVGLTTHYQIDNYGYEVSVNENAGVLVVTAPLLSDCTKKQSFTFSISALYTQFKNQIINPIEYNYWAAIINKSWDGLDVSCLGFTALEWADLSYAQRTQAIITTFCSGSSCAAQISTPVIIASGNDVQATWVNVAGVYQVACYLDGVLRGTILAPGIDMLFAGAADGLPHTYLLVAKCSNGANGNNLTGTFNLTGCAEIIAPVVSLVNITDADCPYDLTTLVTGLPLGITAEWHSGNDTDTASLVANPAAANSGTYYVFAKNSEACYSTGVRVILACTVISACSAPQALVVDPVTGSFRVRFQSAAFPPPLNSYTVKRRLTADPDVDGSYTTIGTPTWNAGVSRWEILDTTAANSTQYTYRAISNCTSSSPFVDYIFSNIICPAVTFTPGTTTIGYSLPGLGGSVDKYEIKLYDSAGSSLLFTQTKVPAFSSPITGTFTGLTSGITYKVMVTVWIGTTSHDCIKEAVNTTASADWSIVMTNNDFSQEVNVLVGNNGTIPSVTLYSGNYGTLPLSGTDPVNFPAIDMSVHLNVPGRQIASAHCNGVPSSSPIGYNAEWTNVFGSPFLISFVLS